MLIFKTGYSKVVLVAVSPKYKNKKNLQDSMHFEIM